MTAYYVFWTYVANFATTTDGKPYLWKSAAASIKQAIDQAWRLYVEGSKADFREKAHVVVCKAGECRGPWVGKYADAVKLDEVGHENHHYWQIRA